MDITGRTVLVTGAARGIGLAVSKRLANAGCSLALWDRDEAALGEAAAELRKAGARVVAHVCDVTDRHAVYARAAEVEHELGGVDVLVNNAGVVYAGGFLDRPDEHWEATIAVNLTSLLYVTRAFLPGMMERDRGHVVNVSSAAGTVGVAGLAVYAATKWAVWGLTESLRHETLNAGRRGIRWSSIHPMYVAEGVFRGARHPGLGGVLFPTVRDHDVVARAVVDRALQRGRRVVVIPRTVRLAIILRGLLPHGWFDLSARILGINRGMESWTGEERAS